MLQVSLQIALDQLESSGILKDYNILLDIYDGHVSRKSVIFKRFIIAIGTNNFSVRILQKWLLLRQYFGNHGHWNIH